jgi:hypothetical protein
MEATMSRNQERAMHYNWGFTDGAADLGRNRWASWFKHTAYHPIKLHFDRDYAAGYIEGRQGYRDSDTPVAIADQAAKYRS